VIPDRSEVVVSEEKKMCEKTSRSLVQSVRSRHNYVLLFELSNGNRHRIRLARRGELNENVLGSGHCARDGQRNDMAPSIGCWTRNEMVNEMVDGMGRGDDWVVASDYGMVIYRGILDPPPGGGVAICYLDGLGCHTCHDEIGFPLYQTHLTESRAEVVLIRCR
jgi:hypothetical protein